MEPEAIARLEEAAIEASRKGVILEVRNGGIMLRSRRLVNGRVYANEQYVSWQDIAYLKNKVLTMKTEPDED